MATPVTVGIVALACVSICGMITVFVNFEMVDKVKNKLSKEEQFAALGWNFSKRQRLHREYRRLYPGGRLLLKIRVLMALIVTCLLICAWGFGFFAK